jgi:hypothetical protein
VDRERFVYVLNQVTLQSTLTPRSIEDALTRHGLNLTWPRRGQVVRIYDSRANDLALVDMRDAVRFAQLERVALNE